MIKAKNFKPLINDNKLVKFFASFCFNKLFFFYSTKKVAFLDLASFYFFPFQSYLILFDSIFQLFVFTLNFYLILCLNSVLHNHLSTSSLIKIKVHKNGFNVDSINFG